jgi:biopolymer transport protein ExbD
MFDRWRKQVDEPQELDLIPVMNLFIVLIPFLLMGAAFFQIGVIPASLPTHTPATSDSPSDTDLVTVNLVLKADALQLTATSSGVAPEALQEIAASWPRTAQGYDLEAFHSQLMRIKRLYPRSNTMIVLPHDELEYEDLVGVLDSARERQVGVRPDGEPDMAELFPVVVFSRFIPAEEPAAEEEAG